MEDTEHTGHSTTNLSDSGQAQITISLLLQYWEEKIVAFEAEDDRMQTLLEREDYFYERVVKGCVRKSVYNLVDATEKLGKALVHCGNFGLGKRYLADLLGISRLEAQELLNQYYAIFHKIRAWNKQIGSEAHSGTTWIIYGLVSESLESCIKNLPSGWKHQKDLIFTAPSYIYTVQAEKFFKHFFDREIIIHEKLVKLPVLCQFS